MKKNTISILTALTTVAFYFLLSAFFPQIALGIKATVLAILAAVSYFFYSAFVKKE